MKIKSIFIACFLIGVFLLVFLWYRFGLSYDFGGDTSLVLFTFKNLFNNFFMWDPLNYSGLIVSNAGIYSTFIFFTQILIDKIFGLSAAYTLFLFAFGFIGGVGLFALIYFLSNKFKNRISFIFALGSSTIFSFFSINNGEIVLLPYIILFFYFIIQSIEGDKKNLLLYTAILIIFISAQVSFGGNAYLLSVVIFLLLFFIISLFLIDRRYLFLYLKILGIISTLSMLISINFIASNYLFTKNVGNQFFNRAMFLDSSVEHLDILHAIYFFTLYTGSNLALKMIEILLLGIFIYSFVSFNGFNKISERIKITFLGIFILLVLFALTINKPFGFIFNLLLSRIDYLFALRYAYSALAYLFFFIFIVIFTLTLIEKSYKVNSLRNSNLLALIFIFIIYVLFFTYVIFMNYGYYTTAIPSSVFNLSNYINTNIQGRAVAVASLPISYNWQYTTWYTGVNIYSSLINAPVYTGGYTEQNEIFFPYSKFLYQGIGGSVDTSKYNFSYLSKQLGIFGINYIIIQGDALNPALCKDCYEAPFSFNTIYLNLNNSNDISFVKKFGNSSVYENSNYVPLVYASDIDNIGNASTAEIFDVIGSKTFNIQNTSVYSTSIDGFYNDSSTINASRISDFSQPNITFVQNTPTRVTVHVHNATTPYYLVFRETYDPHWAAFYSNGTEINPSYHIAVNGFANAWYMNKTGSYTVTLYYTLQTDAWIAWAVSFIALGVTVAVGVYGWMERDE